VQDYTNKRQESKWQESKGSDSPGKAGVL